MKKFVAKKEEKLSKMLLSEYSGSLSFSRLQNLFRNKDIKVNGKRISRDQTVFSGDEVVVYFDGESIKLDVEILYQDDNVLACYKPKGITSEKFYESLKSQFENLYFCHRLDRNTDGVMIFALNESAYISILNGFKKKEFSKTYIATVYGVLENDSDKLTHYLIKDEEKGVVTLFDKQIKNSLKAELEYTVIKRYDNFTEVKINLLTGRTHQIRAQMAKIGHFVLGDGKYGNDKLSKSLGVKELCLSSFSIELRFKKGDFLHYLNGKMIE
ncbi:MAG: RluA family pseudouridine synthase, partial [Clostridia bacterium]|nr:RluA family pseudouridine synthase [Clostridia bacterium]